MILIYDAPKEVIEFLNAMATVVDSPYSHTEKYYYMPYWFKATSNGKLEMIKFEELPKEITQTIEANRNY